MSIRTSHELTFDLPIAPSPTDQQLQDIQRGIQEGIAEFGITFATCAVENQTVVVGLNIMDDDEEQAIRSTIQSFIHRALSGEEGLPELSENMAGLFSLEGSPPLLNRDVVFDPPPVADWK